MKKIIKTIIIVFAIASSASVLCQAQSPTQQQITASYLYNFAKNIEWPTDNQNTKFNILLFRVDDRELHDALEYLKDNVTIHGKPISISTEKSIKSLSKYQLIFTKEIKPSTIDSIYNKIDSKPTLLVTWNYDDKQLVMINLVPTDDRLLKFEVNKSNIINQGLKPYPEIILNGGTEIDVAKLYREGQASLVRLQKQLESRETALSNLSQKITKQENYNRKLEERLLQLSNNIKTSNALIGKQSDQIKSQKIEIKSGINLQKKLEIEVEKRSKALEINQTKLTEIQNTISLREEKLNALNKKIHRQESEINTQKSTISELDEVVNAQKKSLSYLKIITALAILLFISIFTAYKTKRRDNARLKIKGEDLQVATNRLFIAKQRAEEASQAKGEFLSLMSHELRTPLQSIIGYTDVIIEEMKAEGEHTYLEDLQRVINNGERLLRLINGVLDLAKSESGNMTLSLVDTRLSTLIEEAVDSVRPQIERSGSTLTCEVNEVDGLATIDPEKLLQIIVNLLSNAAKFCEQGEITLKVKHDKHLLWIQVNDTGIGMAPDQKDRIFEKFCQADSSTTRQFQGSGLGLTITRQFCDLMGGVISVESVRHEGASFTVNIPLPIEQENNTNNETKKVLKV